MGQLHTIDYAVIAGYFAIIIVVGSYFARFSKERKDYFTAGSAIPWWLAAVSFWMATFSSLAFVTYSELAYKYGLTTFVLYCSGFPGMLVGAFFLVGRWRRARQMSPIGFIETRFNAMLGQVFVWTGIPLRLADNAIRIYATAIFLAAALSSDFLTMTHVIWLTGIITIGFSALGGQWSVIVTDFVQFIIMWLAVLMVFPLSLREVGGFGSFMNRMPDEFTVLLHPPYDLYQYLVYVVFFCFTFNAGWTMIQKYNCVRSERDARKVVYAVMGLTFLSGLFFFLPPMFSRVVFPDLENPRFSYAAMCLKVLPAGLIGVMIAGIFSATLSTLSNEYTMLSSVLTNDFYAKKIYPSASEKHLVNAGRINSLIIGILTTVLAVGLQHVQGMNLFDIMMKAYTAFAPAIMTPLLGGILIRRLNSRGTLIGLLAGFVSGFGLLIVNMILVGVYREQFVENPRIQYWLNQGWTMSSIIINFAVTITGLWIGSLRKSPEEEQARVDRFFKQLETPYESEGKVSSHSPFPVIGITVVIMGAGMTAVSFIVRHMYTQEGWFSLNMLAAALLLITGTGIWFFSRKKYH